MNHNNQIIHTSQSKIMESARTYYNMFEAFDEAFDNEDMNRCLDDWYSRGGNNIIEGDTSRIPYAYRRMPKKPWATKEWVDQRDHKLYTLMKDHFSQEFWQKTWARGYLLPHSPKFHILRDEYDEIRRGKKFRENCRQVISQL